MAKPIQSKLPASMKESRARTNTASNKVGTAHALAKGDAAAYPGKLSAKAVKNSYAKGKKK